MVKIEQIKSREILDSRGFPTLEVDVVLEDGSLGRAAVPSGASTGQHEALELRDGDSRYLGKGVRKAIENVQKIIAPSLLKFASEEPASVDEKLIALDNTENKSFLGANAVLGVSMAFCRAQAQRLKLPLYVYLRKAYGITQEDFLLPTPLFNIINGGKHADSGLDIQEFMAVPGGAGTFSQALQMGVEVYQHLKKLLGVQGYSVSIGDEGGFAPRLKSHRQALDLLLEAVNKAGYTAQQIFLALDAAASEFMKDNRYHFEDHSLNSTQMVEVYSQWLEQYPLRSLEDPLGEDDWSGWIQMTEKLGQRVKLVGDDIFVTSLKRLTQGIEQKAANAILIKLNQI
ncbi:MAG: phosphopyruvate hydratase, partial [Elusimicrobia bacterium]|nr:phosphopyruvate hydratase [Elusimicrobiota bacterium]